MFGGDIFTGIGNGNLPEGGSSVDDCSAAAAEHGDDLMFDTQEHARQVDPEGPLPLLQRQLVKRQGTLLDTGSVECAIELAEGFDGVLDQRLNVGFGSEVGGEEFRAQAGTREHLRRFAPALTGDVSNNDIGPGFGQNHACIPSDAAAGARDDDGLVLEKHLSLIVSAAQTMRRITSWNAPNTPRE